LPLPCIPAANSASRPTLEGGTSHPKAQEKPPADHAKTWRAPQLRGRGECSCLIVKITTKAVVSQLHLLRSIRLNPSSHPFVFIRFSVSFYKPPNFSLQSIGNYGRLSSKLNNLHKINPTHPPRPLYPNLSTCLPHPSHPRNNLLASPPRSRYLTFVLLFRVCRPSTGQREEMRMSVFRLVRHTYSSSLRCFAWSSTVGITDIDLDLYASAL
jgi:hypothetical protein